MKKSRTEKPQSGLNDTYTNRSMFLVVYFNEARSMYLSMSIA